jgi:predicted nucleic acid-binding protein
MTYLVDANILCEPTKPAPDAGVLAWLEAHEGDLVLDSIALGEISAGVLSLPHGRKREKIERWLGAVARSMDCLPWNAAVARRWARLVVDLKRTGQTVPILDSMIAATALEHDLTVATRNVRDFAKTRAKIVNPFADPPSRGGPQEPS